jgi:2,4-dienoyl-CoA reductase-like NADH-dependent reductase (Old Yellow Enzyme family)
MPDIASPLTLPCGAQLNNRLIKAAMSEQMAGRRVPNSRLCKLYRRWAEGGCAVAITGNVNVIYT